MAKASKKFTKKHLTHINSKLPSLGKHFESALKKTDMSDFMLTQFTIEPKSLTDGCPAGQSKQWVPIGNGKYVFKCAPDLPPED